MWTLHICENVLFWLQNHRAGSHSGCAQAEHKETICWNLLPVWKRHNICCFISAATLIFLFLSKCLSLSVVRMDYIVPEWSQTEAAAHAHSVHRIKNLLHRRDCAKNNFVRGSFKSTLTPENVWQWMRDTVPNGTEHRYKIYCIMGQTSRVVSRTWIAYISYTLLSSRLPAPGRGLSNNT